MKGWIGVITFCGSALAGYCEDKAVAEMHPAASEIAGEVLRIQNEDGMRSATIGFCAIDLAADDPDKAAFGFQAERTLIPASTMKAVTAATALATAGGDLRFITTLQRAGETDSEGTLTGDLIIKGGGDPTLGASNISATFAKWATGLRQVGIKKVAGSVVGDASIFGTQPVPDSWAWNDFGNYFGSGASGLTFHQNQFYCTFRPGRSVGAPASLLGTDPRLPGIEFVNEMRTGPSGSGDKGFIYGHPFEKTYFLRGTVPTGVASFTIKGSLPEPAFFCARAFTKYLNGNGFEVTGEPTTARLLGIAGKSLPEAEERVEIFRQESAPVSSLIVPTNQKSINLYAECLHRLIGLTVRKRGTTVDAAKATRAHWEERGVDLDGFVMADGCGLSRANLISPRQMAEILHGTAKSEVADTFLKSLPVAGRSGTLKSIGRGSAAEGRVSAKSGTIDGVKCYAGYLTARSGKRYAFALMVNNYTCELWEVKAKIVRVWSKMVGTL